MQHTEGSLMMKYVTKYAGSGFSHSTVAGYICIYLKRAPGKLRCNNTMLNFVQNVHKFLV